MKRATEVLPILPQTPTASDMASLYSVTLFNLLTQRGWIQPGSGHSGIFTSIDSFQKIQNWLLDWEVQQHIPYLSKVGLNVKGLLQVLLCLSHHACRTPIGTVALWLIRNGMLFNYVAIDEEQTYIALLFLITPSLTLKASSLFPKNDKHTFAR